METFEEHDEARLAALSVVPKGEDLAFTVHELPVPARGLLAVPVNPADMARSASPARAADHCCRQHNTSRYGVVGGSSATSTRRATTSPSRTPASPRTRQRRRTGASCPASAARAACRSRPGGGVRNAGPALPLQADTPCHWQYKFQGRETRQSDSQLPRERKVASTKENNWPGLWFRPISFIRQPAPMSYSPRISASSARSKIPVACPKPQWPLNPP